MKLVNMLIILGLMMTVGSISAQNKTSNSNAGVKKVDGVHMTFDSENINIGKVTKGDVKKFDFVFTNTGTDVIEIDVAAGCDCTTLDYPRHKIKPGDKGVIHVSFDSGKKDASEVIDVDIYLKNLNPKTGQRILKVVKYSYDLLKK
ncbi:MAG: DUF1573 domain-containing protein [Saprospiraceae bacterium]